MGYPQIPESVFVEAMARAMCTTAGHDPDASPDNPFLPVNVTHKWMLYSRRALEQYRAHNAMMKIIFDELIRTNRASRAPMQNNRRLLK